MSWINSAGQTLVETLVGSTGYLNCNCVIVLIKIDGSKNTLWITIHTFKALFYIYKLKISQPQYDNKIYVYMMSMIWFKDPSLWSITKLIM